MISDLNLLLIHDDSIVCDLICKLVNISLSGTKGPEVKKIGIAGGDGCDVRITCVHGVLMLCSGTLLKGVP